MSNAIVKSAGTSLRTQSNDIEFQFDMFRKFDLSTTMAETHQFVPTDDEKHPWKLVKRDNPISNFDNGDHVQAVSQVQKTYAEKIGLNRSRGKYNDESRLLLGEAQSVEVGEIAAWATI